METQAIDWEALRQEIPACKKFIYLNSAGSGPVSRSASNAGKSYYEESLEYGNVIWDQWVEKINKTRETVAQLIGGHAQEIAFLPNSSLGMNYIAHMLNHAGDVIMCADEFPSCSLPWLQKGYHVKWVASQQNGKIPVDQFASEITETTKVIVTSHVQYATGYRQNLENLGAFCRDRGIHLVVDATQSVGAFPVDVHAANVDFMVFSGYKWLNAGCGISGFFIDEKLLDSTKFPAVGWRSARHPYEMAIDRLELAETAEALELGHQHFPSMLALGGAVNFINEIGIKNITQRIHYLTDYLHQKLNDLNIKILSPHEQTDRAGITSVSTPNASDVVSKLKDLGIIVAKRGEGIRISLHYYNNFDDIDHFIEAFDEIRTTD